MGSHCSDIHSYCHSYNLTHVLLRSCCSWQLYCQQHSTIVTAHAMEKPTVLKLLEYLVDLTDCRIWIKFAQHLPGIEKRHIDHVTEENKGKVDDQKKALYKKWLEVYPNASWNDVIEALEKAERKDIALTVKTQEVKEKELIVYQDVCKGMRS